MTSATTAATGTVKVCLAGDVMLGRGIDQIQAHPGDPTLYEEWMRSAEGYVELAAARSGSIPIRVAPDYVWGSVRAVLHAAGPVAFIANLETAITDRGAPYPGKGIHYRMHPANLGSLTAGGLDVVSLANNHVLDWSTPGLEQTLDVLDRSPILAAGAGRTTDEAWEPVIVHCEPGRRLVVLAAGTGSAGIPREWAAGEQNPGVALLRDLSDDTVDMIAELVDSAAEPGDLVVLSVHWGGNWGYSIDEQHRRFAQLLVDHAGVHLVHGHSSHHPKGIEIHHEHLILHGCGDLITDYEGIGGHRYYRGEIGAVYLATLDASSGQICDLELAPTRMERFRLTVPARPDREWLAEVLTREGAELGTSVTPTDGPMLSVSF